MRFEDRWNLWKADQPPEQNLSIHLLDLFLNARKEITSKLSIPYKEEDILQAAKEVLIVQTNTGITSSLFNCMKQMYNKSIKTFVSSDTVQLHTTVQMRVYVFYTDQMVCDWLLVGMHNETMKTKAIRQWNSKDASGMSLTELTKL